MNDASEIRRAEAGATSSFDEAVWAELVALEDADAVLLTDGRGRTLKRHVHGATRADLAEIADIAISAVAAAGGELGLGAPRQFAASYAEGVLVGAVGTRVRAVVLARKDANIGRLLLLLRLLFPGQS